MPGPKTGTPLSAILAEEPPGDDPDVVRLAESIRLVGLISPLVVSNVPELGKYRLLAGRRRLAACRSLGWYRVPTIDATPCVNSKQADEWRCEHRKEMDALTEIDENLVRSHLTPEQRRELTERRDGIVRALAPRGGARDGAGAPQPKTPTRGQRAKQKARGSDNQNDTVSRNVPPAGQSIKERDGHGDTPGRPENEALASTATVAGVSRRQAQRDLKAARSHIVAEKLGVPVELVLGVSLEKAEKIARLVDDAEIEQKHLACQQAVAQLAGETERRATKSRQRALHPNNVKEPTADAETPDTNSATQPDPPPVEPVYRSVTLTISESPAGGFDLRCSRPVFVVNDKLSMLVHPDAAEWLKGCFQ